MVVKQGKPNGDEMRKSFVLSRRDGKMTTDDGAQGRGEAVSSQRMILSGC